MDFSTRLRGINPTNTVFYSPQPRAEVYCLLMNFKISKLAYWQSSFSPTTFFEIGVCIIYGFIIDSRNGHFPVGLVAQLVEHWTSIAEVRVRVPVRVRAPIRIEFFRPFSPLIPKEVYYPRNIVLSRQAGPPYLCFLPSWNEVKASYSLFSLRFSWPQWF